jgi:hypothetical protein
MPSTETEAIDEARYAAKLTAAAKQRNASAMANLTMEFEAEGLLGMIYKSMSSDWQVRLAHLVIMQLFKKCSPDDRITRVELRSMLGE